MVFLIRSSGDLYVPTFDCDQCGEEVGGNANVLWPMNFLGDDAPLYVLHKACTRQFEREHPLREGEIWGSFRLSLLPLYLAGNFDIPGAWVRDAMSEGRE